MSITATTSNLNLDTEIKSSFNWVVLITICLGSLMVVIDETIVNVALPTIKTSLGFSNSTLAWVVNAYLIAFGGFLLLTGKIGDIYGYKKIFLLGIFLFTFFSFTSGISTTQTILLLSRIGQGISGAIISAIALSLIMMIFKDPKSRTKAMGVFGFILAGGGSIGVFMGGVITSSLGWNWIFFINIPIGLLVFVASYSLIPESSSQSKNTKLDILGAFLITLSLILAVYGIVNGNEVGWLTFETIGTLFIAIIIFIIFIVVESKTADSLIPLSLFKLNNLVVANAVSILWAASMFAWFFLSALYMQFVLLYKPLDVGLAFLPGNIISAVISVALSGKLVDKFGIKKTLTAGLSIASFGLLLFARAPINGQLFIDILPGMILLGIGSGIAFNPVLLAAMSDVEEKDSGLASGLVNTSFVFGGALGLAILASVASTYTTYLQTNGSNMTYSLNSGYNLAFLVGFFFALIAICLSMFKLSVNKVEI